MDHVERIARQVPGWQGSRLVFTQIDAGITNRNVKVTVDDGASYVLRFPGERTELLGIDRAAEVDAATRAAHLGIGPPVHGALPGVGTLITEFVLGEHADFTPERIATVVGMVRRFHDSGPLAHAFPIFRVTEWHARDAVGHGGAVPTEYATLHDAAKRIEAAFDASPEPGVPCHNDLLPANVLFGVDRAWLIDFEYAGMNDRYFDLANLSVNSAFDAAADKALLTTYFGEPPTPRQRARLQLMKIMSEFREGMWAVVQQAISALTNIDFAQYANERLGSCRQLCERPDFEVLLGHAAAAEQDHVAGRRT